MDQQRDTGVTRSMVDQEVECTLGNGDVQGQMTPER